MTDTNERIRVLRQVEHGVLSDVEKVNGIVALLKELARENKASVAVAAVHCLRRAFSQLLDPTKNPQLPPPRRPGTAPGGGRGAAIRSKPESQAPVGGNKKRSRDGSTKDAGGGAEAGTVGDSENAARVYQEWLEARYIDFIKVLLSWVAEVGDFHRQGIALKTLMHFVEIEPSLCVRVADYTGAMVGGDVREKPKTESGAGGLASGDGTIWSGLFREVVRALALGPTSMQARLLKALGDDYVNLQDDIRYYLLGNVIFLAKRALADHEQREQASASLDDGDAELPVDSPLRGYSTCLTDPKDSARGKDTEERANVDEQTPKKKKKKRKDKKRESEGEPSKERDSVVAVNTANAEVVREGEREGRRSTASSTAVALEIAEVGGRLAELLMTVRMVEEQSDLTAFLLPVALSVPERSGAAGQRGRSDADSGAYASSSDSGDDDDEDSDEEGQGGKDMEVGSGAKASSGKGGKGPANVPGGEKSRGGKKKRGKGEAEEGRDRRGSNRGLVIQLLRYHKKVFGDAWLACLRLPMRPALYKRVLLFLPGNVIPYMPSPVRLADFLTSSYSIGGVTSVLALDALFLLMQEHDLDYPDFYDSLYRLVTPTMMYAKYRAKLLRMVDLCLSSTHVPAYVIAAFLKRFGRVTLEAPPMGALFTLALARKLLRRHPECLPLINYQRGAKEKRGVGGEGKEEKGGKATFVDEFDASAVKMKDAGALKTSLWEVAALQNHYHPAVATLARGLRQEMDRNEAEREAFGAPSKLSGETFQSLFEQEMRGKVAQAPLAFRRPKGILDDIPEEGGGALAAMCLSLG